MPRLISIKPRHHCRLDAFRQCFARRLIWLLAILTITACSATSFIYNRLHLFIPWVVDDYVSLNAEQEEQLEHLLKSFIREHRQDYLPRYVAIINQLLVTLDEPITADQLQGLYRQVEAELVLLQAESLNWMLDIGDTASDQQMQEFLDNLQKQQQEDEERFLRRDAGEYQRDNYDRLKDLYSGYLGRLSRDQLRLLEQCSQTLNRIDHFWVEQQRQRTTQLAGILLNRDNNWKQRIRDLIERQASDAPPQYQQALEENIGLLTDTAISVINSRSNKQDRRLRAKLQNLRDDLRNLSRQQ